MSEVGTAEPADRVLPDDVDRLRTVLAAAEVEYQRARAVQRMSRDAWAGSCQQMQAAWQRRREAYDAWQQAVLSE